MFTTAKCHSFIMKTCALGMLTSIERSDQSALGMLDNLLTTYDNLKQVATAFVHRGFDNLTTFYRKICSKETLI